MGISATPLGGGGGGDSGGSTSVGEQAQWSAAPVLTSAAPNVGAIEFGEPTNPVGDPLPAWADTTPDGYIHLTEPGVYSVAIEAYFNPVAGQVVHLTWPSNANNQRIAATHVGVGSTVAVAASPAGVMTITQELIDNDWAIFDMGLFADPAPAGPGDDVAGTVNVCITRLS